MSQNTPPRLIAYYLPQYHPIPENDAWWGKGFTEWTNVAKARPLFKGHYQPHIPADLGFYDLRVPEVREAQAKLAREAGIEGFCYWHYWFAGKHLLERPFNEVLASGKPDFPFCLAWANATWTGIWYDAPDRILMKQTYPGAEDHQAHFKTLLPAFMDERYIQVDGKPVFLIFQPLDLSVETIHLWQKMAVRAGLKGIYFTGIVKNEKEAAQIIKLGFDACTISLTNRRGTKLPLLQKVFLKIFGEKKGPLYYQGLLKKPFAVFENKENLPYLNIDNNPGINFYPCVMPNWDNTPRAGLYGQVWKNSSPEIFRSHLHQAIGRIDSYPPQHKIIIIKSWNEWAEGNYLEPDQRFGHGFLEAVRREMSDSQDG